MRTMRTASRELTRLTLLTAVDRVMGDCGMWNEVLVVLTDMNLFPTRHELGQQHFCPVC